MTNYLVCFDMDRVLVDHLSTWQYVYDQLGISNDESFALYNQGLLNEWDWIKLDLALIQTAARAPVHDQELRSLMQGMPMMKGWRSTIQHLLDIGVHVAIVSGGLQTTARDIAATFPSNKPWTKRWGGINRQTAEERCNGNDTLLHVFTNGWLMGRMGPNGMNVIQPFGRYQVEMNGKGSIVQMLQRRIGVLPEHTASVGDSAGDIGMFQHSACGVLFNPWDEKPLPYADHVIHEKDLMIVLNVLCDRFGWPKP